MASVARLFSLILLVAATAALPVRASRPAAIPGAGAPGAGPTSPVSSEAVSRYLAGRLLEERGLDVDALEEYRQALRLDPEQPAIELRVSEIAARLGDALRSLEFVGRVLKREPGNARALWLQGSALFNLGRAPEALKALQTAVVADSGQLAYWRTLAHAAESLDQIGQAAEAWRHAVQLDEGDGESWFQLAAAEARLGRFAAADSMLAEAMALNPVRPGALFLGGWIQEGLGRRGEAMRLYRQHLLIHPGDQATRRRLVSLLVDAGLLAEAYGEAGIVRKSQPNDPEVVGVEADLALRLGRVARADELLDQLLQSDPDDPGRVARAAGILMHRGRGREAVARTEDWAWRHAADHRGPMLLAQACFETGDTVGALAAAQRAVEMAPDTLAPRFLLGGLLQAGRRLAAAESVWVELTGHAAAAVSAGLRLGYCREQRGDVDGAVTAIREVLAREPDNASALNSLGYLLADHNRDLAEAAALVRRALAREPDNGAFVDSMGWVYYRLGLLAEARRELERAVELTGGDPVVREHLGDVYKDLNLFELAREQYLRGLDRDQDNARLRAKLSAIR